MSAPLPEDLSEPQDPDAVFRRLGYSLDQDALAADRARYAALVPPKLCPDPQMGTREGWEWCGRCAAIKEPGHGCYR